MYRLVQLLITLGIDRITIGKVGASSGGCSRTVDNTTVFHVLHDVSVVADTTTGIVHFALNLLLCIVILLYNCNVFRLV